MKKNTQLILVMLCFLASFVTKAQHTITSFSPTSGEVGTTVSISGENFDLVSSNNIVKFNNIVAVVESATNTMLTVIVPNTATTGEVTVQIGSTIVSATSLFSILDSEECNGISTNNAKHWYFGMQAALKFENNIPIPLTNSAMNQTEGVATMSDANGNLLFYTNGITVFNKNHQTMLNGSGLLSHQSNTQAAFIVPFPQNPNQYFIVTPDPYRYSIVDMTLDNGNGGIILSSKNTLITNEASEKVAGLLASNQRDIWLITYSTNLMRFNVYKITETGLNLTPVISNFTIACGYYGYMKVSPDGTKIVTANFNQTFHIYDFDASTGIVSNQRVINFAYIGGFGSYGIEFSPNGNLVYVADHRGQNKVHQFDITLATPELIAASKVSLDVNGHALGALQLGSDNKIYTAKENSLFLGVINNPNVVGTGCNYTVEGLELAGKRSNLGLPGFITSSLVRTEPYIISFAPTSGFTGDEITINGLNFSTLLTNNLVKINGVEAVVTAATDTSVTIIVPENATTGLITIEIGCGLVTSADEFTVEVLDINQFSKNSLKVHPNPSQGIFTFSTLHPLENATAIVTDVNGRIVQKLNGEQLKNATIDLSLMQNGMYILKINSLNNNYIHKLIKR